MPPASSRSHPSLLPAHVVVVVVMVMIIIMIMVTVTVTVMVMAKLGCCHRSHPGTCKSEGEISIFAFLFLLLKQSLFSPLVLPDVKVTPDSLVTRWFGFGRINSKIPYANDLPMKLASRK